MIDIFDHNTLAEIFNHLNYRTLYIAVRVNKQWCNMSKNQLNISRQSNPILPILHNKQINNKFINNLYELYDNYIIRTNINFHGFLKNINSSSTYGYDNREFMAIFNESNKIDLLYEHVINHLHIITYENNYTPLHRLRIFMHTISLFEKGFVILTYFKLLLTSVYYPFVKFIYDKTANYSIWWNIGSIRNKMFDK